MELTTEGTPESPHTHWQITPDPDGGFDAFVLLGDRFEYIGSNRTWDSARARIASYFVPDAG